MAKPLGPKRYEVGEKIDTKFSNARPYFFVRVYDIHKERVIYESADDSVRGLGKKFLSNCP